MHQSKHDLHQLVGAADSQRQANRGSRRQRLSPRLRHIGYARFADNIRLCRIKQRKDILSALRRGNSFITNSPDASRLVLSYKDCVQGDEVKFVPGMKVHLHAEKLRKI